MHTEPAIKGCYDQPFAPVVVPSVESPCTPKTTSLAVMHVINGEHFSGAERVQQLLGKKLGDFGVQSYFACVKPGKFHELCGLDSDQVIPMPMRGRFDLSVGSRVVRAAKERSIQILHAHTPRTALICALASLQSGIPWCYHVHSPTSRDSTRSLINKANTWTERLAMRSCSQLITVSKSLRREMLRLGVDRRRLTVVANGVPEIQSIDAANRINSSHWRLGLIALMRPRKGVEVALEAMSALVRQGAPIELELIGGFETDEYQQQILGMIDRLNLQHHVHWTGFTKDVPSAIQRLDALLLPSLFGEGMPMVVLEALSAGVPVVATRVEGTPEVIRHGVEGFLAEPRNSASLAMQVTALISSRKQWQQMSARALLRHRQHFSDSSMAKRIAQVYRKMTEGD